MINCQAALRHYFLQVAVAERVAQIPSHAQNNDHILEIPPPEQCCSLLAHRITLPNACAAIATEPIEDHREEGIRTIRDVGKEYLEGYALRNRSATFAEYAVGHVSRLLGTKMLVDVDEATVHAYQEQRLREKAAPKTINEEVGFLLRLLGERGELLRAHLRKQKTAKAYSRGEKQLLA